MAHTLHETRTVIERNHSADDNEDIVTTDIANTLTRIIYLIGSVIIGLLSVRFVLMLLGANHGSAFVDFIYTLSHPFVAPFFGMFSYREQFGIARFEVETLVAIVVYVLLTWLIVQLVNIGNRHAEV